jgi:hypothetical protein
MLNTAIATHPQIWLSKATLSSARAKPRRASVRRTRFSEG